MTEDDTTCIIDAYLRSHGTATEDELEAVVQLARELAIINAVYELAMTGRTRLTLSANGEVLSYREKVGT